MNKTVFSLVSALAFFSSPAVLAVESVPVNVTEEMLFADDPKDWLTIARVSAPQYPKELLAKGITGHVDIEVTIDELGKVKKIGAVTSKPQNAAFEESARESVRYWTFYAKISPECVPEVATGNVRVWFEIRDGKEAISVSSTPGTMGSVVSPGKSKWRPLLNQATVARAVQYPPRARKEGEQGSVFSVIHVDAETGRPFEIKFSHAISSRGWVRSAFELAVRDALKMARFEPSPEEKGLAFRVCMPFTFKLSD